MGRIAVALTLLIAVGVVSPLLRLPVALAGCGMVSWVYPGRMFPVLLKFFLVWLVFFVAVAAGRAWAGTAMPVLVVDGAGSLGLALGVAGAVLLVVTSDPVGLLRGFDRLRLPREMSYAVLSLVGVLPQVRATGSRQLALLRLKGIGTATVAQRFRAYPRIVAPLFGQLLHRQVTHARSMTVRGFFAEAPRPQGHVLSFRDLAVMLALLAMAAAGIVLAVHLG